jgi:hypothetical protein
MLYLCLLATVATASGASTARNPELQRAEALIAKFRYEDALAALGRARAVNGNSRETLIRILELQGVVAGQLRRSKTSEEAFRDLLVLDPDHQLSGDYAPRVATPFFEAKRFLVDKGSLVFKTLPAPSSPPEGHVIGVRVESDPLNMARSVRFHVRAPLANWSRVDAPLVAGQAKTPAPGDETDWWAELIGDHEAVLALVGEESNPILLRPEKPPLAPPPLAVAPPDSTPFVGAPPAAAETTAFTTTSATRIAGYCLLGGAVVAAGGGGYFIGRSSNDLAQINDATTNSHGVITGISEKTAYNLNTDSQQTARIGEVLFGVAAVLAAGGVVLWLLGGSVVVTPAPNGVSVSGSIP